MKGTEVAINPRASVSVSLSLHTLQELQDFCKVLAGTDMVPKAYKDKAGDILVAMLHGQEVGLPHLQALQSIAVVNGVPSIYGDAALALVRASGKLEDFDEWIEVDGVRQDRPFPILKLAEEGKSIVAYCLSKRLNMAKPRITTFSVDDAQRAKLWLKKGHTGFETPWCTVPQRMLMWRARGWNLRDQFGDVLKGLAIYEEAMDFDTAKGADGAYRVPTALPGPSDEMREAVLDGQRKLMERREGTAVDVTPTSEAEPATDAPATEDPREAPAQDAPNEALPGTRHPDLFTVYRSTCAKLDVAQSVAEVAALMNAWLEIEGTTAAQRKEIDVRKANAMKRFGKK